MNEKKWEDILSDIDELEKKYFPDSWLSGGKELLAEKEDGDSVRLRKKSLDDKEREIKEREHSLFTEQKEFLESRLKDKNSDYEAVKSELIQANQFLSKEIERYHKEIETMRGYVFEERKNVQGILSQKFTDLEQIQKEIKDMAGLLRNLPKALEEIKKAGPAVSAEEIIKAREQEKQSARLELAKLKQDYEKKIEEQKKLSDDREVVSASSLTAQVEKSRLMYYDDVTRGVVHRIKNFLGIIEGSAQFILENMKLDPDLKDQIQSIDEGARELEKSINEFSSVGRIPDFAPSLKNAAALLKAEADKVKAAVKDKKIEILVELPEDVSIMCDEKLVSEAFYSILMNAAESIQTEGKIAVRYEKNTKDKADIFLISDNGAGISEAHLGKIFQPFFTNKKNWKGMGLTYAKRNLLMHNGDIVIESQKGKGTIVKIIFPQKSS